MLQETLTDRFRISTFQNPFIIPRSGIERRMTVEERANWREGVTTSGIKIIESGGSRTPTYLFRRLCNKST